MAETSRRQSWWHSLPGILTAIAGTITALTGLVAALYQAGILEINGNATADAVRSVSPSQDQAKPATHQENKSGAQQGNLSGGSILMPDGNLITIKDPTGGTYRYEILSAQRELLPPNKQVFRFRIRAWTDYFGGLNFWADSFRLYIGDVHLKPVNNLNELLSRDETKDADIEFEVDGSVKEAILVVKVSLGFSGNTRELRLILP